MDTFVTSFWSLGWPAVLGAGVFSLLFAVFVHECGHFVVGRMANVYIREFSIGVGPVVCERWFGVTRWVLRAFPVFAYVRPASVSDNIHDFPSPPEGTDEEYVIHATTMEGATWLGRFMIYLAGPLTNFLTAFLLLIVFLMIPERVDLTQAWWKVIGDPANVEHSYFGMGKEGVFARATDRVLVVQKAEGGYKGMLPGDFLLAIDDCLLSTHADVGDTISTYTEKDSYTVLFLRNGTYQSIWVPPNWTDVECLTFNDVLEVRSYGNVAFTFHEAAFLSAAGAAKVVSLLPRALSEISLRVSTEPVQAARRTDTAIKIIPDLGKKWRQGLRDGILTLVALNIGFAIFNLIPFPLLDGGKLVLLLLQLVTPRHVRARASRTWESWGARWLEWQYRRGVQDTGIILLNEVLMLSITLVFSGWFLLAMLFDAHDFIWGEDPPVAEASPD